MTKSGRLIMLTLSIVIIFLSGYVLAEPLHDAAKEGNLKKVKSLIEKGADVSVKNDRGITPLHFAGTRGYKDIAELLISKGADVNAETKKGYTPLHWAAMDGHIKVADLLITGGANVNSNKTPIKATPLYWAARKGYMDVVKLLISKGANINAKTIDTGPMPEYTPLSVARTYGHNDVAKLIRKHGGK